MPDHDVGLHPIRVLAHLTLLGSLGKLLPLLRTEDALKSLGGPVVRFAARLAGIDESFWLVAHAKKHLPATPARECPSLPVLFGVLDRVGPGVVGGRRLSSIAVP